ncbi:hypothetical protein HDK77DRAFT_50016 [Phyllosticta capitalensis]|uniref:Uncharacterized protein n=1 Tax=Phyllosticta capitalensis TaxID=121624 RepID=A0ABR1YAD1_9PEZI
MQAAMIFDESVWAPCGKPRLRKPRTKRRSQHHQISISSAQRLPSHRFLLGPNCTVIRNQCRRRHQSASRHLLHLHRLVFNPIRSHVVLEAHGGVRSQKFLLSERRPTLAVRSQIAGLSALPITCDQSGRREESIAEMERSGLPAYCTRLQIHLQSTALAGRSNRPVGPSRTGSMRNGPSHACLELKEHQRDFERRWPWSRFVVEQSAGTPFAATGSNCGGASG